MRKIFTMLVVICLSCCVALAKSSGGGGHSGGGHSGGHSSSGHSGGHTGGSHGSSHGGGHSSGHSGSHGSSHGGSSHGSSHGGSHSSSHGSSHGGSHSSSHGGHGSGHGSHSGSHHGSSGHGNPSHNHGHSGPNHGGSHHGGPHHNYYHSSSESHPVYIIRTEHEQEQVNFPDCAEHYAITDITTNVYSDGTKRSFSNSTIYNSDGTVFDTDCTSVKHTVYENDHYFIIGKRDGYRITDEDGNVVTSRNYPWMSELEPNRLLVRRDKKYGIINLSDETIVPIKYDKFENVNNRIMIAKLNGYYGVIDYDNNTLVYPDCERIKPFYDTLLLKRYHKYGLASLNGEKIFEPHYDKIKKLGEYIVIKKDDKYGVLNAKGEIIEEIIYKKIKLERNRLRGMRDNTGWIDIFPKENTYDRF